MKKILERLTSNRLALDSIVVFIGTMGANIGSYLYHLVIGRILGKEAYGEISSLFSLLYIFTVPILVSQTVLVKFVSTIKAQGTLGQAKSLFIQSTILFLILSILGLPFVLFATSSIGSFLHLSNNNSFLLLYILIVFTLISVPAMSITQGYQKFIWFSLLTAAVVLLKLLFSIPLVPWGVSGMLWAAIFSAIVVLILYLFPIRNILKAKSTTANISKKDAFKFAMPTLIMQLGITSMYSTDIIMVRHYFTQDDAGTYAAVAILGKIIFFASSAIAQVSFPVLAEQSALKSVSSKIIKSSIGGVLGISAILVLFYFIAPKLIVTLLFGNAFEEASDFLGMFGVFIAFFSVGNIVSVVCLALGKTKISWLPGILAIGQLILFNFIHGSIKDVIYINILISALFALGSYIIFIKSNK